MATVPSNETGKTKYQAYLDKYSGLTAAIKSPQVCGKNKALLGLAVVTLPSIAAGREENIPYLLAAAVILALLICWNAKRDPKVSTKPRLDGTG